MRWLIFFIVLLSGCATKPVSTFHTYKTLQIQLSQTDESIYALIDGANHQISQSTGKDGTLNFSIPMGANDTGGCFYIINQEGKSLFEKDPYFSLPLLTEYKKNYSSKSYLENQLNELAHNEKKYRNNYETAWKRLKQNRAFKNNTCYTPEQKQLPQEPYTKCETETECREEGGAICFSRFLGTEGCDVALKELGMSGLLSSPTCGFTASKLANEKYDMGDAIGDVLHGLVDVIAEEKGKSDSLWDNFIGAVLKGGSYAVKLNNAKECTNDFVDYYFGPKRRWLAEVDAIKREPIQTRNECFSIINEVNSYHDQIKTVEKNRSELSESLQLVNLKYEKILNEKQPISYCN